MLHVTHHKVMCLYQGTEDTYNCEVGIGRQPLPFILLECMLTSVISKCLHAQRVLFNITCVDWKLHVGYLMGLGGGKEVGKVR